MELDSGVGGEKTEGEGALQTEDGSGQRKSSMQKTIQISLRLNNCLQIKFSGILLQCFTPLSPSF
jgi:hypothetical protein